MKGSYSGVYEAHGGRWLAVAIAAAMGLTAECARAGTVFLGPTAYLSSADSPFDLASGNYCLEDFEDGVFDAPGVTANGPIIQPPGSRTDSVDGDDGSIDGSGNGGYSYFAGSGAAGITFTFDEMAPGGLPTEAGVVWTDGTGTVTFEAFGAGMVSLGTVGPGAHPDGVTTGTTAEDRFYGIVLAAGIAAIKLTNTGGGIEVDHLQYESPSCPAGNTTTTTTASSTSTTSTTSTVGTSTTTTTLLGETARFLPGKKLLVKQKKSGAHRLQLIVKDPAVAAASPCEVAGELVIEAVGAGSLVRRVALDASLWKPINAKKPEKGCKYRKGPVVATVLIKAGKMLKVIANANDLGIPLATDPRPVRIEVRHGDVRHCMEFGGQGKHKPDKKLLAKKAGAATGCPTSGSPSGAFLH